MTEITNKLIQDFDTSQTDPTPSRRTFLRRSIYAVAAGVTTVCAVPVVGYFIAPATSKEAEGLQVAIGKVGDLANQTELKTVLLKNVIYTDSFKPASTTRKVFVRALKPAATSAEDFLVLDSICTHAGCSVDYRSTEKDIYCGCHGSYYDQNGNNVKGPAPRPLGQYEVKIENGEIMINIFQKMKI
jgi:cytochrome b6-f complex iron-sulfur subunit